MLQSHRPTSQSHGRPQSAAGTSFRPAAAPALTLPTFADAIPGTFATVNKSDALLITALTLADAGILTEWHGDLRTTLSLGLQKRAAELLPNVLADYTLLVVDDTVAAEIEEDSSHGYQDHCGLSHDIKISALIVTFSNDYNHLINRVIGPTILRLEARRPGLGHTVLYWLHKAFAESARALDPINGIEWADYNYWGGNGDETEREDDELSYARQQNEQENKNRPKGTPKIPFDEAAVKKDLDIFRRSDYDAAIPPRFGTAFKHKPQFTLNQLRRLKLRGAEQKIIDAVVTVAGLLANRPHKAEINDIGHFERCRWDMSPYLLRWSCNAARTKQDPLAQIYDDYMNDSMQSGEDMLDVNAVFAWHDTKSLVDAVKRFETYCRLLAGAENLLRTIAPKNI